MNASGYLQRLRQINASETRRDGTAQTEKTTLRSLCSSDTVHKKSLCSDDGERERSGIASLQAVASMRADHEATIRAWLAHIGAHEVEYIADVLDQCRTHPDALAYFLTRSAEVPKAASADDSDRRRCTQCTNLSPRGRCLAARRGEIDRIPKFEPIPDMLHRCAGYSPSTDDSDRRRGWERWNW